MLPLAIRSYTTTSAAGVGKSGTANALRAGRSALVPNDLSWAPLDCWIGRVAAAESATLPRSLERFGGRIDRVPDIGSLI